MTKYDPKEAEPRILKFWEEKQIFAFNPDHTGHVYSIDTPPPTISGNMHIGHAFAFTQQDIIARYKRMKGYNVFMPFGTDDNGLPTIKLIENTKGIKESRMDRQEFIDICHNTLKDMRPAFIQDWKNIGISCDFNLRYSTIDAHCRKISQNSFLDLAKKGLVYRKEAPIIWDPVFQTAIAQAELEDIERKSTFNYITFTVGDEMVTIGTTRPELIGACVALFVHPTDARFKKYVGKVAATPIYHAKVPIIADERVDPEKGTGIVMCCTFGDQTDIEWYKQYELPLKTVIGKDGKMTKESGAYEGMKVTDARKAILEDLKQAGVLERQEEITQTVNVGERSGAPVEIIHSPQWYVAYLDRKEQFTQAAKELNWHPKHMRHRIDNWIDGLNWDWSISRQRSFGVPIPVWYDKEGNIYYADESQLPIDPLKTRPHGVSDDIELIAETDTFDTWFTSASTPFLAIELVDHPIKEKLFPMDLRPQGHDIINFWLFYTLAKTQLLHKTIPWKDVTINGFVLDPKGRKMSKSKGNVVAPQDAVEKFSADALRFWAGGSKLGDDLPYQEKDLKTGDKLVTKLWNASRFAFMHDPCQGPVTETLDKYILAKLNKVVAESTAYMDSYEYARAKLIIETFFWDFCDNYLELIKLRLYEPQTDTQRASAQSALYTTLYAILRLFSPFVPFITEEIYQTYFKEQFTDESIHISSWPEASEADAELLSIGNTITSILTAVRKKKSEAKASMRAPVKELHIDTSLDLGSAIDDLKNATNAENIEFGKGEEQITPNTRITITL